MHPNKKNNRYVITASAASTVLTLAIMIAASIMATAPAAATTTTTPTTEAGIELSPQPVYQEWSRTMSLNPVNQTHVQATFAGNGTLNLPNGTETINTTASGSVLISEREGTAIGKEVITIKQDGSEESATATFFGITRQNLQEGTTGGIVISLVDTNSTGRLAPLDGMILAGLLEIQPDQTGVLTLWEWQSGIPLPTPTSPTATTTPEVPSPLTDTTATMTNATAATDDTNETTAATAPEEEVGGGEEEQQQQQQTTPTITPPLSPNPLFE
ncbi:MAG: hypothetical protein M3115_05305 [Thermoproteota archaeon]|nr:hypothetical protein [Thermoproteota archaeon]